MGQPHLHLKQAHRMLAELGVKAHLIPGDPQFAISRVANTVLPSDLVIIDGSFGCDSETGRAIATWLPRLCHSNSTIFACDKQGGTLLMQPLPEQVVDASSLRKAA